MVTRRFVAPDRFAVTRCGEQWREKGSNLGPISSNTCVRQGCIVACQSPSTLRTYKQ
jgi:hypothetical protein